MDANPNHIKNIHVVHVVIKSYVVMMTNIQNLFRFTEEKIMHINK